ncbi:hypothetical protein ANO11243_010560 [Dothideomycetidae sp. 11243]|nr:hypothetical protein ANO11243_010560 [fungal sp. No.11243]
MRCEKEGIVRGYAGNLAIRATSSEVKGVMAGGRERFGTSSVDWRGRLAMLAMPALAQPTNRQRCAVTRAGAGGAAEAASITGRGRGSSSAAVLSLSFRD